MSAVLEPEDFPDDVTALARAVGVYRDPTTAPVPYLLTDLAGLVLQDHLPCEYPTCPVELCYCPTEAVCAGAEISECPHHRSLCREHLSDCVECVLDWRHDGDETR